MRRWLLKCYRSWVATLTGLAPIGNLFPSQQGLFGTYAAFELLARTLRETQPVSCGDGAVELAQWEACLKKVAQKSPFPIFLRMRRNLFAYAGALESCRAQCLVREVLTHGAHVCLIRIP